MAGVGSSAGGSIAKCFDLAANQNLGQNARFCILIYLGWNLVDRSLEGISPMGMLDGYKGLVFGVANERSIAWHVAKALMDEGATCGFAHLPDTVICIPVAPIILKTFQCGQIWHPSPDFYFINIPARERTATTVNLFGCMKESQTYNLSGIHGQIHRALAPRAVVYPVT